MPRNPKVDWGDHDDAELPGAIIVAIVFGVAAIFWLIAAAFVSTAKQGLPL